MAVFNDTTGNDTIVGTADSDQASFTGGNDQVGLGAGDDSYTIQGLSGNADHSTVAAGDGTDVLIVAAPALSAASAISIDLAAGSATIGAATFALSGFERVLLDYKFNYAYENSSIAIAGNDGANFIKAQSIDFSIISHLEGRDGDDTIVGGLAHDLIDGGNGNDLIYGETASNTINGGAGDDTINGGCGGNFGTIVGNLIDGGTGNDYIYGGGAAYQPTGGIYIPAT